MNIGRQFKALCQVTLALTVAADAADRASVFVRPVRNNSYHIRKSPYLYVHYLQGTEEFESSVKPPIINIHFILTIQICTLANGQ